MKMKMYTMYDKLAMEYGPTFEQKNDACAVRSVKSMFKDTLQLEDYQLYNVGDVIREDGQIEFDFLAKPENIRLGGINEA